MGRRAIELILRNPVVALGLTIVGGIAATIVATLILAYIFGIGEDQSPPETTTITVPTP